MTDIDPPDPTETDDAAPYHRANEARLAWPGGVPCTIENIAYAITNLIHLARELIQLEGERAGRDMDANVAAEYAQELGHASVSEFLIDWFG